jgi:6-pyruvoyltetrahydropterin/6-carboxytetrahydropterin synthase
MVSSSRSNNGMTGYNRQSWTLHIRKDSLKFSAAHMTVFPHGGKEGLHGHNYQVELAVELAEPGLGRMLSYEVFKQALRTVCAAWDEKVLIAGDNPWLETLPAATGEYAFRLCGKVISEKQSPHSDRICSLP